MTRSEDVIFVGREEELQNLINFARNAFSGKAGVVFVTGEAGIGKTSLVGESFRQLKEEYGDLVIAAGRCKSESASYFSFRSIMEDLLGSSRIKTKIAGGIVDEKRNAIRDVVIDVVRESGSDVVEIFFPPAAAKIIETIPQQQKELSGIALSKSLEQVQIFGWYTKIMKAISQRFPLALFIDDLHLADISSLNLLLHLGREIKNDQMLVVGAYRPHETKPDSLLTQIKHALEHLLPISTHRPHETTPDPFLVQLKTELERYGAKEFSLDVSKERSENVEKNTRFVHDYLIAKYGTNFSERFEECLIEISEGNPLFLTEVLIDFWVWRSYAPESRLILAAVVGPRTSETALTLIQKTARIVSGFRRSSQSDVSTGIGPVGAQDPQFQHGGRQYIIILR